MQTIAFSQATSISDCNDFSAYLTPATIAVYLGTGLDVIMVSTTLQDLTDYFEQENPLTFTYTLYLTDYPGVRATRSFQVTYVNPCQSSTISAYLDYPSDFSGTFYVFEPAISIPIVASNSETDSNPNVDCGDFTYELSNNTF